MRSRVILLVLALAAIHASAASAANWDESVGGDLSNSGLSPSLLPLTSGNNFIKGNFGAPDLDYLTVVIADGFVLDGITTGVGNLQGLSRSFIGVQAGSVMTVLPTAVDATGLLGWTHFGTADGVNLLPAIGVAKSGSTGFTGPLSAGTYTFWFNETTSDPNFTYDFNFRVASAPVPLPAAFPMLLSGLAAWGLIGRRQRNKI